MFAQTNLVTAESPNGCPRVLSSDTQRFHHAPQDDISPRVCFSVHILPDYPIDNSPTSRFPERNKVPDFSTFSSLLRITSKYEMPAVRSQLLEVVRDAYPETFEGLGPSKQIGENVFSGQAPHPNEVLNLFVEQKITSALPMAYYMAARRGPGSLMSGHPPRTVTLSPGILRSAVEGLMALREVELNETHRLIFEPESTHPCSVSNCLSHTPYCRPYQSLIMHHESLGSCRPRRGRLRTRPV